MLTQKDSHNHQRTVAPIFVHEALACGRKAGIDIPKLLRMADVSPNHLNHLTTAQFGRVWMTLSRLMQDEFFGLGARPMRPGSTTLLGHAVRDAKTLEIALHRTLRFLRVVLDDPHGSATVKDGNCAITLQSSEGAKTAFT